MRPDLLAWDTINKIQGVDTKSVCSPFGRVFYYRRIYLITHDSYPPLPTSPSVEAVDVWLKGLGLKSETVGSSYQNRDITMYEYDWSPPDDVADIGHLPTVLIISLVHGNEVMGLLALLQTIHNVVTQQQFPQKPIRVLFIPFVNVDAYTLNIQNGQGYRRTNLRPTCQVADLDHVTNWYMGGVDLNRNHPTSWEQGLDEFSDCSDECGRNYHGPQAWSEPEAQAIRDVVLNNNVTAALSFHSRSYQSEAPLLIHPYTSNRFFSDLPARDRQRFLSWKQELNEDSYYVAGTAQEAIHYTAGGSTIDWMYSVGVTSFVVEVVPPCKSGDPSKDMAPQDGSLLAWLAMILKQQDDGKEVEVN